MQILRSQVTLMLLSGPKTFEQLRDGVHVDPSQAARAYARRQDQLKARDKKLAAANGVPAKPYTKLATVVEKIDVEDAKRWLLHRCLENMRHKELATENIASQWELTDKWRGHVKGNAQVAGRIAAQVKHNLMSRGEIQ